MPIPLAMWSKMWVWSKVWVCGHLLAGIVDSYPADGMDVCLL